MKFSNVSDVKAHLGKFLKEVKKGKIIYIAERNIPVAQLKPIENDVGNVSPRSIKIGVLKGKFKIPSNFNDAMIDFEDDFYGK